MKVKTSITLSDDLLAAIDRVAGATSRSAFIESILRRHLRARSRAAGQQRDLERLNAAADRLNAEMAEVLELQAGWPDDG